MVYKHKTTTVHQVPDLGQVQTFAAGFHVLMVKNPFPFLKQ